MKGVLSKKKTTIKENKETGTYTYEQEETNFSRKNSEDMFFYVFPSGGKFLQTCKSAATIKIAFYLISRAGLNTGDIQITKGIRTEIVNLCKVTNQTYYTAIKELVEIGVILQKYIVDKRTGESILKEGEYLLNPIMFWRGDKHSRKLALERVATDDEL